MKVFAYILIVQLTLSSLATGFAQTNFKDSLQNLLSEAKSTHEWIDMNNDIAESLLFSDTELARKYLTNAIAQSQIKDYSKGLGEAYSKLGIYYAITKNSAQAKNYYELAIENLKDHENSLTVGKIYNNLGLLYKNDGNHKEALENFQKAEVIAVRQDNKNLLNIIYNNEGTAYRHIGDYESAIKSYLESIKIKEELGNLKGIAVTNGNIANLYYTQGQYEKALDYNLEALDIIKSLNEPMYEANIYINIISYFTEVDQLDSALYYYKLALDIFMELEYDFGIATSWFNRAEIYIRTGELQKALNDAENALTYFQISSSQSNIAACYIVIGEINLLMKNYAAAYENINKGINLAEDLNNINELMNGYENLFKYFQETGDYKQALESHVKFAELKDQIFNIEKNKQINEIIAGHQLERKERENELLRQMFYRKEAENKALTGAVLLFFMFTTYFFHVNQAKKRHNLLLIAQNADIYGKQESILAINRSLQHSQKITQELNDQLQLTNSVLETKVADRTAKLAQAVKELDTFLYQSSHALRRPLVNILGLAKIVHLEPNQQNLPEFLSKMYETARKMDGMLKKLVMVSEINSGSVYNEFIDFEDLFKEVYQSLKARIEEKNIRLSHTIQKDLEFLCDKRILMLILHNILENSINFSFSAPHKTSWIKIEVEKGEDKTLLMHIEDNGSGILNEAIPKIFNMFAVADNKSHGYGLGLYIVKKAIEKLEGRYHISSKKFEYTSISIELPYLASQKQPVIQ